MRLRIQLRPTPDGRPGHGELVLTGWEGAADALEVSVQRNSDGYYLDDSGNWGSAPVHHNLADVYAEGETPVAAVGSWLVDPLLAGTGLRYQLTLRNAEGENARSTLAISGTLLSSAAAGQSQLTARTAVHASTAPPPPPAEPAAPEAPEAVPESAPATDDVPAPPPPQTAKKSLLWLWLLLGVLLLALVGAALWWFLLRDGTAPGGSADAGDTSACGTGSMANTTDDLLFIRTCLNSQPSSARVLEVIAAAKAAKRCNLVQRLYAHTAQAGDVEVALAYAREYDPQSFSGGCIEAADPETAVYWYEIVTEHAPDNQQAKQRLEELSR